MQPIRLVALLLAFTTFAAAQLPAQAVTIKEDTPGLKAKAALSADSAIAIARRAAPAGATIKEAELEEEDGHLMYSFDFRLSDKPGTQEIGVDARSGKILENSYESPAAEAREASRDSTLKPAPYR